MAESNEETKGHDMSLMDSGLHVLSADETNYEENSAQEMNKLMVRLRQLTQELTQTSHDFESVVKQKDLLLNKCENDFKLKTNEFQKQINELNNSLLDVKTNRDLAQNEINSLKTQLSASEVDNQSIRSTISAMNEKNQSLEIKCQTLLAENQRMRQSIDFELKAKYECMETIKSLTNSLNDNQKEIERLNNNWSELEKSRISEINGLKNDLSLKEQQFMDQMNRMSHEKSISDKKTVNDMNSLIKKIQETDEELHRLRAHSDKERQEFESFIGQKDKTIVGLESDMTRMETQMNNKIRDLVKQLEETNHNLSEMTIKREKALSHLTQMKAQLITADNEKEVFKTSLVNANEKCYSLEFRIDSLNNEIEKYNKLFENITKEKTEKNQMIETITDSLSERQSEIERLNNSVKELEKSRKDSDESRTSLMDDCNELRTTLMEVEKSRIEVRRELNNYKISYNSIENKLKNKDNEVQDLRRQLETVREERNSLNHSIQSSSKALTQLKDINMNLSERNKQLSAQISLSESERREFARQLNSSLTNTNKDNNVLLLKKDNELLRERIKTLENEKKRLERSYSLLEKEKSVLKTTFDDNQRKTTKTLDNNSRNDVIDEANIITQGLAALELKNIELQRKVQGLQCLMNETEGLNGSDCGHEVNGDSNDLGKLRLAQRHAEDLIGRKDFSTKHSMNFEKELTRFSLSPSLTSTPPRFKDPPIRSQSVSRVGHPKQQYLDAIDTSTPLPSYSSTSALNNVKRKLNYNKN